MKKLISTLKYNVKCKGISKLPYSMMDNHKIENVRILINEYQNLESHEFYKVQMLKSKKPSLHNRITNNKNLVFDNLKIFERKVEIICEINNIQDKKEREFYKNRKWYRFNKYQDKKIDLTVETDLKNGGNTIYGLLTLICKPKYL